jgi:hypothetical protein
VVEAFEIAPEGDGLSMAIHSWLENDFDIAGRLRRAGSLPAEPPSPPVAPVAPHQREQRVFLFDTDGWGRCPFCDVAFTITNPGSLSAFHTTCRGPLRLKANSPSTP